jgi:hypothetical protein
MKPKKIKDINPKVASSLGMTQTLVEKVNDHYWSKVKECINFIENDEIYLHSLGSFEIKPWKIPFVEAKYLNLITLAESRGYSDSLKNTFNYYLSRVNFLKEKVKLKDNKKKIIKDEFDRDMEEEG